MGFMLSYFAHHPRHALLPGAVLPNALIGCRALRTVGTSIRQSLLASENDQLDFQSVCQATCSDKQDERNIRNAIHGREHAIDNGVRLLMEAGRYNAEVLANVERGMSGHRAGLGLLPFGFSAGCCLWVLTIGYMSARCGYCEQPSITLIVRLWCAMTLLTATMVAVVYYIGECAIGFTAIIFGSGLQVYVIYFFIQIITTHSNVRTGTILGVVVVFLHALGVVLGIAIFYSGCVAKCKSKSRTQGEFYPHEESESELEVDSESCCESSDLTL